jgi:hypothetical protein
VTPAARNGRRRILQLLVGALLAAWLVTAAWQMNKALPDGLRIDGAASAVDAAQLHFLADTTAADAFTQPVMTQQIHAATLELIAAAHDLLVVDYFLFNGQQVGGDTATGDQRLRPIARELREALLARRRADPQLPILVLVDPINAAYGTQLPADLATLQAAGIDVVLTDLDPLRDSNALYSAAWRGLARWWLAPSPTGSLPNLLESNGPPMSLGAWLRLLNFKANHRKVAITGDGSGSLRAIVGSANPHDASSAHSNVALQLAGPALLPLLQSELAIARFSGWQGQLPLDRVSTGATGAAASAAPAGAQLRIVTEGAIRAALLQRLDATQRGDEISLAMFYLSDRPVVRALLAAARRGVSLRILLDPNKDAFGHEKSGLPNRQVAAELVAASDGAIRVRWYRTHGEQFHAKLVLVTHQQQAWLMLGSANLTRRNLGDYNLEADAIVESALDAGPAQAALQWFDTLWVNRAVGGIEYTADVDVYADPSTMRYWLYRFVEASGLSTF